MAELCAEFVVVSCGVIDQTGEVLGLRVAFLVVEQGLEQAVQFVSLFDDARLGCFGVLKSLPALAGFVDEPSEIAFEGGSGRGIRNR